MPTHSTLNTLFYVPIEPLEERYTEQWYRWFPNWFKQQGINYLVIDGITLTNKITHGAFLDTNSTFHYKATQLQAIAQLFFNKKVKDGDIFFVADIEFPGIESIKYLATLNGIDVKLYGFCHAASYTKEDFFQKTQEFAQYSEQTWFNVFDKVFVGSDYHKQQILKNRMIYRDDDNIIVTGNPYDIKEVRHQHNIDHNQKENIVVCTNRPDYEKRPNLTLDVFGELKRRYPSWRFIVTTGRDTWGKGWIREKALDMRNRGVIEIHEGLSKSQYFDILAKSKIMTGNSIEENFGYCILEAIILGSIPVLPNNYSHPELCPKPGLLFDDLDDQIKIMSNLIESINTIHTAYSIPLLSHALNNYDKDVVMSKMFNGGVYPWDIKRSAQKELMQAVLKTTQPLPSSEEEAYEQSKI